MLRPWIRSFKIISLLGGFEQAANSLDKTRITLRHNSALTRDVECMVFSCGLLKTLKHINAFQRADKIGFRGQAAFCATAFPVELIL